MKLQSVSRCRTPASSPVWRLCFRGADVAGLHTSALFVFSLIFFAVIITSDAKLWEITDARLYRCEDGRLSHKLLLSSYLCKVYKFAIIA